MYFITFEGVEGSGKSTQAKMLYDYLFSSGKDAVLTREPGGVESAERIRDFVLRSDDFLPVTELLLHNAARYEHIQKLILPCLKEGKIVICDRFVDSTLAYQGKGMQLGVELPLALHKICQSNLLPDLTFVIDIDPSLSVYRARSMKGANRYDYLDLTFHQKVREGFLEMANQNKDRCILLNGNENIDSIHRECVRYIERMLVG